MTELLLPLLQTALLVILVVLVGLRLRAAGADPAATERLVRIEAAGLRAEQAQREELRALREETQRGGRETAQALREELTALGQAVKERLESVGAELARRGEADERRQEALRKSVDERLEAVRLVVEQRLEALNLANAAKLEEMRATVDEKLHATLETRLTASFSLVSERLEKVQAGLGEMQNLATGVGDLKRVLTNVKSRGGWAEIQLGWLLEQTLAAEQYRSNVRVRPDSNEIVEFAICLPGDGESVWLPIDAKFPKEDYERLLEAYESADPDAIERHGKAIERAIRDEAKKISDKYVCPPHTTNFAIMYLPTEGLFAEVIRRPGLVDDIQTKCRVTIAGPTTFTALLNSLQMGFRTLAIQQRSGEVWKILGATKSEFEKFTGLWEKLGKQLSTAQNTVEEVGKKSRTIARALKNVESESAPALGESAAPLLAFDDERDAAE
jgi:DNA recombination protein RmuC